MGQGRRQTERITSKPGGVREAGSKRSGEGVNGPGSTQIDTLGKPLVNVSQGKTRLRGECI